MPRHPTGTARPALLALACALAVAGCADRAPPPPAAAQPAAPVVAGPVPVDGTYGGSKQVIASNDGPGVLCGTDDPFRLVVAGRTFHYVLQQPETPYQPTRSFDATIAPDGSFSVLAGPAGMRGTVSRGGHMQGEIDGDACSYLFQADRGAP
jgi:hypothetical protein